MSGITTHVLDLAAGRPAAGIAVTLSKREGQEWEVVATRTTDADGRISDLLAAINAAPAPGVYRLHFALEHYFQTRGVESFYPYAEVTFTIRDPGQHHHVPLLLSPFGYSTYRGS